MGYKRGIKLFSSKRGMDIDLWFNMFEFVIVFIVGVVLLQTVNSEAKNTTYEKLYFSRDSALLISSIYSAPGNIEYYYPDKTDKFIFNFKQNTVEVYESRELIEGGAIGYPFPEDKNYQLFYTTLVPKKPQEMQIVYSKDNANMKIKS